MKVEINEYDSAYHIELTPENLVDVNSLARLQMNSAKGKPPQISTYASRTSGLCSSVVICRTKNERSWIK